MAKSEEAARAAEYAKMVHNHSQEIQRIMFEVREESMGNIACSECGAPINTSDYGMFTSQMSGDGTSVRIIQNYVCPKCEFEGQHVVTRELSSE